MTEYTDFESWKAAGIAAGLSGPTQVQGKDMWVFGTWTVVKTGHGGAWTGTKGEIGETTASGRPSLNTDRGTKLNAAKTTAAAQGTPIPHSALQPVPRGASLNV
jgi:hypothetical protein